MIRLLSALALSVPALWIVWFAPPAVFLVLVLAVSLLAAWEFHALAEACGWEGVRWEGTLDVGLFVLAMWAGGLVPGLALTLIFLRVFVRAMSSSDKKAGLARAGVSLLGLLWIGGAGALAALIRPMEGGREALVFLFAVVWANDIGAYFVGRAIGIRRLAASISPGKTVEGAAGGLIAGGVAGTLAAIWLGAGGMSAALAVAVSLVLGVLSQMGDLCESFLKRAADRKDSGTIIPGHGGVLDRIDGLLIAAPPFYYFLKWFAGR